MQLPADATERYVTKVGDGLAGPYDVEALESLAFLGRLTPETLIARAGTEHYAAIKDTALVGRLFPKFGSTLPVLRVKASWPAAGPVPPPAAASSPTSRSPLTLGEAKFERLNSDPSPDTRVEVTDLLGELRAAEIAAGRDKITPRERVRVSRRSRDFWLLLLGVNGLLLAAVLILRNPVTLAFGLGGMGLFTFGLVWSMFGVMDRY